MLYMKRIVLHCVLWLWTQDTLDTLDSQVGSVTTSWSQYLHEKDSSKDNQTIEELPCAIMCFHVSGVTVVYC